MKAEEITRTMGSPHKDWTALIAVSKEGQKPVKGKLRGKTTRVLVFSNDMKICATCSLRHTSANILAWGKAHGIFAA